MAWLKKFLLVLLIFFIVACQQHKTSSDQIIVGTIAGPDSELMKVAKKVALERYHVEIKIVEFDDYNLPNQALADGSIDANMFQHLPYLHAAIAAKHYDITPVAKTFIYPMGIYSYKIKQLSELPQSAVVAVPNDPSNETRALLLLQKAKLVTLKPNVDVLATKSDILFNPYHLRIKEIDAAQLPRVLPDVTIALINSNYAVAAGLIPQTGNSEKNAIFLEGDDSLYANLIVVRTADKDKPQILKLVSAFQSPEVLAAAKTLFNGNAIKAW